MRRLKGAALAILKGLFGATVVALILFAVAVLVGIVLVAADTLFG